MRLAIALGIVLVASTASAQVAVRGYVRQDGTYVSPHFRSAPDGWAFNNYSALPPSYGYPATMRGWQGYSPRPYGYGYGSTYLKHHSGYGGGGPTYGRQIINEAMYGWR